MYGLLNGMTARESPESQDQQGQKPEDGDGRTEKPFDLVSPNGRLWRSSNIAPKEKVGTKSGI
jgi:hypothetical protein